MVPALLAVVLGLILLVWSADRFVDGAAATASHFRMPPLLIGMVIVGFGTSAPEMVVSSLASLEGSPGIALGNAYGSNITNIALILGITALINPITVDSKILRRELPVLTLVSLLAVLQLQDAMISRSDAWVLLAVFAALMLWTIREGIRNRRDEFGLEIAAELAEHTMPLKKALMLLAVGLVLLVTSSRILVWGAVEVARGFGIDELLIGLTIVAIGTSLPELASSVAAARKGEDDIALGNILGSNLFNTLAVVGIAGALNPLAAAPELFTRDISTMFVLTLSLFIFGYGFRSSNGRINRVEGSILLAAYVAYTLYLAATTL